MTTEVRTSPTAVSRPLPRSEQLDRRIDQGGTLREGSRGAPVEDLQRLLVANGCDVGRHGVDGKLGPDTSNAVRAFQRKRGLEPDGVVGPDTLRALKTPMGNSPADVSRGQGGLSPRPQDRIPGMSGEEVRRRAELEAAGRQQPSTPPSTSTSGSTGTGEVSLAPRSMSEREKWDHYSSIIKANGGQVCADGKPTVLGIRGMDKSGRTHESKNNRSYDDTFVVLTPDKRVIEVSGATHAGQTTSSLVDHVGRVNAGNFRVVPNGAHHGEPSFHVRTMGGSGNLPGVRDRNDDGRYSAQETEQSQRRGDTLSAVLFHVGFQNSPRSIGCMTMSPQEYQRFLGGVGSRGFSFTLVDANR